MPDPTPTPIPEIPVVPVVQPPDPVMQKLDQMQQMILSQQAEIQRLGNVAAPAPVVQPAAPVDFYTDPKGAIRQEVKDSIAPLNAFISMFQRTQAYNNAKPNIKMAYPNLASQWHLIEPQLDRVFGTGETEASPQNVNVVMNNIVGSLLMNNPAAFQAPGTQTVIPPSISPAAPVVPANPNNAVPVVLTEQQKVLARYNGMTDEEFARGQVQTTIIRV